jgi:hypothetical protein
MVKGMIKSMAHAAYESIHRTFPLSEKPGYGKGLFDGITVPHSETDSKPQSSFDSERFIHAKVHPYLSKFAANLQALKLAQHQSNIAALSPHHNEDDDILNLALHVSHRASHLTHLPKPLRAFVLVHLLRESDYVMAPTIRTLDRDELKSRMALKRILISLGAQLVQQKNEKDSAKSAARTSLGNKTKHATNLLQESQGISFSLNDKDGLSNLSLSQRATLSILGLLIVSGMIRFSSKHTFNAESRHNWVIASRCTVSVDSARCCDSLGSSVVVGVWKRRSEGFGTAPVWYQQSMETGPPDEAFSLGEGKNSILQLVSLDS